MTWILVFFPLLLGKDDPILKNSALILRLFVQCATGLTPSVLFHQGSMDLTFRAPQPYFCDIDYIVVRPRP